MRYIPGLPNNPPTHLVEYFHNKPMVESVQKQLNYVIGSLLNSLQTKAASLKPVELFLEQMLQEKFNGQFTLDFISKGIDYVNYCVATKDLVNIRQGWPKLSDDLSIGMSAAFVMNNNSMLAQIPQSLHAMVQNSANAMATEITAATNFSNNGSINMYQQQYPMMQQGVQQYPANGVQAFMQQPMQQMQPQMQQPFGYPQQAMQQPMQQINQQQLMMFIQSNPQLMQQYQMNPQYAVQLAQQMLMQQQMQNPYMQRANTVSQMQPQFQPQQASVQGFINNNNPAFGVVPQNQVGTARASSYSKAPANTAPQQVQLNQPQQGNSMINANQHNGQFNVQNNQQFQPQPTLQQPSPQTQVVSANVVHGTKRQAINMTQEVQPISNAQSVPQHAVATTGITNTYSNLADQLPSVESGEWSVAADDQTYNVHGRCIGKIYSRDHEIIKVRTDAEGVVIEDVIEEAKVKYEEHESQRILPTRTKAEKAANASTTRMNEVLELASAEVSYKEVLEKIAKDQKEAGEELVEVDVSRILVELGTNAIRLDKPVFTMAKDSILPIIEEILTKNKIPVDTATRSVINDVVVSGPLIISGELADALDKLNSTKNLDDYIANLTIISNMNIPNFHWTWIHDEILKEINEFLSKYYGLPIDIDSVLLDLDDLITYVGDNFGNNLSTQMYVALHSMLTSTVVQVIRHDNWPDIVGEGQVFVGKIYRVVTLPIVTCQVPYNTPGLSGIVDRNTHTQLVTLLDKMMRGRDDYHSILLITIDGDIIEVNSTTIDGNYIMYCGNV